MSASRLPDAKQRWSRRHFLGAGFLAGASMALSCKQPQRRPNIVLINNEEQG